MAAGTDIDYAKLAEKYGGTVVPRSENKEEQKPAPDYTALAAKYGGTVRPESGDFPPGSEELFTSRFESQASPTREFAKKFLHETVGVGSRQEWDALKQHFKEHPVQATGELVAAPFVGAYEGGKRIAGELGEAGKALEPVPGASYTENLASAAYHLMRAVPFAGPALEPAAEQAGLKADTPYFEGLKKVATSPAALGTVTGSALQTAGMAEMGYGALKNALKLRLPKKAPAAGEVVTPEAGAPKPPAAPAEPAGPAAEPGGPVAPPEPPTPAPVAPRVAGSPTPYEETGLGEAGGGAVAEVKPEEAPRSYSTGGALQPQESAGLATESAAGKTTLVQELEESLLDRVARHADTEAAMRADLESMGIAPADHQAILGKIHETGLDAFRNGDHRGALEAAHHELLLERVIEATEARDAAAAAAETAPEGAVVPRGTSAPELRPPAETPAAPLSETALPETVSPTPAAATPGHGFAGGESYDAWERDLEPAKIDKLRRLRPGATARTLVGPVLAMPSKDEAGGHVWEIRDQKGRIRTYKDQAVAQRAALELNHSREWYERNAAAQPAPPPAAPAAAAPVTAEPVAEPVAPPAAEPAETAPETFLKKVVKGRKKKEQPVPPAAPEAAPPEPMPEAVAPEPAWVPREDTTKGGYRAPLGTKRIGREGYVDVLTSVPISELVAPQGNRLYPQGLEKYKTGDSDYPQIIPDEGKLVVDDGNHRIEAARQRGETSVNVWLRQPGVSEERTADLQRWYDEHGKAPTATEPAPAPEPAPLAPAAEPAFETGKPVTFPYIHNREKAPKMGARFGQDVEPAGQYIQYDSRGVPPDERFEAGKITFQNPLVVPWGGGYQAPDSWKKALSEKYNGKKGKALSDAIRADGHDGIVTMTKTRGVEHASEIVNLKLPETPKPPESKAEAAPAKKFTVAGANAALKAAGYKEKLVRGRGYYYFSEGNAMDWYSSSIMTNSIANWTPEQIVAERNSLAGEDERNLLAGRKLLEGRKAAPAEPAPPIPAPPAPVTQAEKDLPPPSHEEAVARTAKQNANLASGTKSEHRGVPVIAANFDALVLLDRLGGMKKPRSRAKFMAKHRADQYVTDLRELASKDPEKRKELAALADLIESHRTPNGSVILHHALEENLDRVLLEEIFHDHQFATLLASADTQANDIAAVDKAMRAGKSGAAWQKVISHLRETYKYPNSVVSIEAPAWVAAGHDFDLGLDDSVGLLADYITEVAKITGKKPLDNLPPMHSLLEEKVRDEIGRRNLGEPKKDDAGGGEGRIDTLEPAGRALSGGAGRAGRGTGRAAAAPEVSPQPKKVLTLPEAKAEAEKHKPVAPAQAGPVMLTRIKGSAVPAWQVQGTGIHIQLRGGAYDVLDGSEHIGWGTNLDEAKGVAQARAAGELQSRLAGPPLKTDTPEFRRWFGDSKVIDEDGAPLVVFHGAASDFDAFDKDKQGSTFPAGRFYGREGFFFTSSPEEAGAVADWAKPQNESTGPHIKPVYLSIENPYVRKSSGLFPQKWYDSNWRGLHEKAKAAGHDGIIVEGTGKAAGRKMYVVFEPEQIKSIFNRGTYDSESPDILQSRLAEPPLKTDTPEFKRWFGDSKVVDSHGPVRTIHASQDEFDAFNTEPRIVKGGDPVDSIGAWFAVNPALSNDAGGYYAARRKGSLRSIPAYLSIKNPLEVETRGHLESVLQTRATTDASDYNEWRRLRAVLRPVDVGDPLSPDEKVTLVKEIKEKLRAQGFDGIHIKNDTKLGEAWIAFDPTQIKSAIGNVGTYDPENPDILQSQFADKNEDWLRAGMRQYAHRRGRPFHEPPAGTRDARAMDIADAYAAMEHRPDDPEVKASYSAVKKDLDEQWDYTTKDLGVTFEPWEDKDSQPYANSTEMMADVRDNHHLYFFRGGDMPADHPLAEVDPKTGFTYNDKLRAVHDFFGHAVYGHQFGERGEENAWISHSQHFSRQALPALTSETKGQNNWVNFGPHMRGPDGTLIKKGEPGWLPAPQRPFAEQKAGLLPLRYHYRSDAPFSFISPNTLDIPSVTQAQRQFKSDIHRQFVDQARQLADDLGLNVVVESALGSWQGGAENSIAIRYPYGTPPDLTKYYEANLGRLGYQYATAGFTPDIHGKDTAHFFWVDGKSADATKVASLLLSNGIENSTIVPAEDGHVVTLIDAGDALQDNIKKAKKELGAKNEGHNRGSAEFPGNWTDRDAAERGFLQTIEEVESGRESLRGGRRAFESRPVYDLLSRAIREAQSLEPEPASPQALMAEAEAHRPPGARSIDELQSRFPKSKHRELSTRVPVGIKSSGEHMSTVLMPDFEALENTPGLAKKTAALLREYPNFKKERGDTPGKTISKFIDHAVSNLLFLHDQMPPELRERAKLWYEGANTIANRWSKRYGKTLEQTAGTIAVLSPQRDWFQNVSLAERILDTLQKHQETEWSDQMTKFIESNPALMNYPDTYEAVKGKKLSELKLAYDKAMWIRVYDEAHNPRGYRTVSPEGELGEFVRNAPDKRGVAHNRKVQWGTLDEIGKAISIYEDGSTENISANLGGAHKVRNFYNNIGSPDSKRGFVTIDTHAVAAGLLRPLAGSDIEVLHNMGAGVQNGPAGIFGTYPVYAEAYRRAAEARGILPREMQSITWEAVRGLFTPKFKMVKENKSAITAIWKNYNKGEVTIGKARREILKLAGGIVEPAWVGTGGGKAGKPWASSYTGELDEVRVPARRPPERVDAGTGKPASGTPATARGAIGGRGGAGGVTSLDEAKRLAAEAQETIKRVEAKVEALHKQYRKHNIASKRSEAEIREDAERDDTKHQDQVRVLLEWAEGMDK